MYIVKIYVKKFWNIILNWAIRSFEDRRSFRDLLKIRYIINGMDDSKQLKIYIERYYKILLEQFKENLY